MNEYDHMANLLREGQDDMEDTNVPPPEAPPPNNASAPSGDESAGADAMDNDSPDADGFSVEDLYSTIVEDDHDVDGIGVH